MAFSLPLNNFNRNMEEFFLARGARLFKSPDSMWVVFPSKCANLTAFGCKIYEDRPVICKSYDGSKMPFMKGYCKWDELQRGESNAKGD